METEGRSNKVELPPASDIYASVRSDSLRKSLNDTAPVIPIDHSLACQNVKQYSSTTSSSSSSSSPSKDDRPSNTPARIQNRTQIPTTTLKRPSFLLLSLFLVQILLLCGAQYLVSVITLLSIPPRQNPALEDLWIRELAQPRVQVIGAEPHRREWSTVEGVQWVQVCVWTVLTAFNILSVCLIGAQIQELLCVAVAAKGETQKISKLQRLLLLPCYAALSLVWVHLCVGWLALRYLTSTDASEVTGGWSRVDQGVHFTVLCGLTVTFFVSLVWSLVECARIRSIAREETWEPEEEEDDDDVIVEEKEYQIMIL